MYINWDETFAFNPHTFEVGTHGIPFPSYGLYGGPGISGPGEPKDALDTAFREHDEGFVINESLADVELIGTFRTCKQTIY